MSMKKAIIENGKVVNIIECSDEGLKGLRFPAGQIVWDCGQYPVAIGDDFADGVFTREGEPLPPIPTIEQKLAEIQGEISDMQDAKNADSMISKITEMENAFDVLAEGLI